MNHIIIPIYNGSFTVRFGQQKFFPDVRNIPSFCFLLIDEQKHPVLVDTGFNPQFIPGVGSEYKRDTTNELSNALQRFGYSINDIEVIIQTHLHWDHTGGMELFPAARFLIQASELDYIANIPTIEECSFCPSHWISLLPNFQLLQGTTEIKPGLRVIWTGGHTGGHQVVEIQTSIGKVILGGDAPFNYERMWAMIPEELWPIYRQGPGKDFFWTDEIRPIIREFLQQNDHIAEIPLIKQNITKLKSETNQFITSHDPRLLTTKTIPHI